VNAARTVAEVVAVIAGWAIARFVFGGAIGEALALGILVVGITFVIRRHRQRAATARPQDPESLPSYGELIEQETPADRS